MMKFWLWMKQGNGCDYTVGCGERLVELTGDTISEARMSVPGALERYGISNENTLDEALILSFVEDAMPMVRSRVDRLEEGRRVREVADKRAQLERLKKELGES